MLYVVTAVHNRYKITEAFIDLLLKQTYKDIQLILVDDGSTDGTAEMVKCKMPSAIILKGNGKLWWGGSLHKAYKWICSNDEIKDSDYIMFSNDDVKFENDYIEKAISILEEKSKILLVGYGVSMQTGKQVDGAVQFDFPDVINNVVNREEAYGNCASTRSLFFRVGDFKCIGGFHPVLLPHYGSDYEWTIRASKKGYKIYCTDKLQYGVDEDTTGIKQRKLKAFFSKRAVSNPFYKINFAILAAPVGRKFLSVFCQILRFVKRLPEIE